MRCEEPRTFELRHRLRGEERIFRVTATPLDHAERPIGIVFHDVTEAQRAQTIRRDFVANASHELRSPLTLIRGYVETLLDSPDTAADEQERTHALTIMKKHADRVVQLVEDMLTLARMENSDRRTPDCCSIEVEDDGIGIAEEALPFIFNRFYRADRTGRIKGTGLGLAIVRHAVEAHGGTVRAESAPNERTTFRITLPRTA